MKGDIHVKDVTKVNWVIDIGTKIHKCVYVRVTTCYLPYVTYRVPSTYVRLYSPHTYHHIQGVYSTLRFHHVIIRLKDCEIIVPINLNHSNLHLIKDFCE